MRKIVIYLVLIAIIGAIGIISFISFDNSSPLPGGWTLDKTASKNGTNEYYYDEHLSCIIALENKEEYDKVDYLKNITIEGVEVKFTGITSDDRYGFYFVEYYFPKNSKYYHVSFVSFGKDINLYKKEVEEAIESIIKTL